MMKQFTLTALLVIASLSAYCGNAVPPAVMSAFNREYAANAVNPTWNQKNNGAWEVSYKQMGKQKSVLFLASGQWKEIATVIPADQLPEPARNYVKEHNKNAISQSLVVVIDDGTTQYRVHAGNKDYIFNENGIAQQ